MDSLKNVLTSRAKVRSSVSKIHSWESNDYYRIIIIVIAIYVISFMVWCRRYILNFFRGIFKSTKESAKDCLIKSIVNGDYIKCYCIIRKYNIINEMLTPEGYTPLLIAAQHHHTQIVKYLIQNGADLKAVTAKRENAFYLAAYSHVANMKRRDAGCMHALFHAGIDINQANAQGYTALHLAAYCGHKTLVAWLLMKKARVDLVPLPQALAKSQGHYEISNLLSQEFYRRPD